MTEEYITIKADGIHEIEIKKSRFITHMFRIDSEEHAKSIIQETKKEHWKANHNCSAFVIGSNNAIQRSSDDGEPSGTAGIPMLEVLKKQNVSNTLAVVTRYFGGIKLGSGGLIRAYSQSVSEAILAIGLVKGVLQQEVFMMIDYAQHNVLQHFLEKQQVTIQHTDFSEKVNVMVMIDLKQVDIFNEQIVNLLHGQVQLSLGEKNYFEQDYQKDTDQ